MLEILDQVKARAPAEFPFFGRQADLPIRADLAALGPGGNQLRRFALLQTLGHHELLCDESPRRAIEHLNEAYELFPRIEPDSARKENFEAWNWTGFFLAVAWLRRGETENCCASHSPESRILPIRGGGVHTNEEGSRNAIKYFQHVLENVSAGKNSNQELGNSARWLLNIATMTLGEYPQGVPERYLIPVAYFQSEVEFPRFKNVAPSLGLETYNHAGGVIVDDFDNDGDLDLCIGNETSAEFDAPCQLFHNNGNGTLPMSPAGRAGSRVFDGHGLGRLRRRSLPGSLPGWRRAARSA